MGGKEALFFLRKDVRQEHLAPWMEFSCADFSHVHCMALCLPQEQVAFWAQTQESERPQQVVGLTILDVFGGVLKRGAVVESGVVWKACKIQRRRLDYGEV